MQKANIKRKDGSIKKIIWIKNIYLKRFVKPVNAHFNGEKNGEKIGKMFSIVVSVVETDFNLVFRLVRSLYDRSTHHPRNKKTHECGAS